MFRGGEGEDGLINMRLSPKLMYLLNTSQGLDPGISCVL
jgi:hypothetical protein